MSCLKPFQGSKVSALILALKAFQCLVSSPWHPILKHDHSCSNLNTCDLSLLQFYAHPCPLLSMPAPPLSPDSFLLTFIKSCPYS